TSDFVTPGFFFVRTSHLPTPTLCPYTTLFRSRRLVQQEEAAAPDPRGVGLHYREGRGHGDGRIEGVAAGGHDFPSGRRGERMGGDRKSTRLNSSHVKISYAVFCLKKKILMQSQ